LCWRGGQAVAAEFRIFPNKPWLEQETTFAARSWKRGARLHRNPEVGINQVYIRAPIDVNQAVQVSSFAVEGAIVVHAKVTCPARK
jgi:hypothetical protein